jgi:SAM-dependent methyltransferase
MTTPPARDRFLDLLTTSLHDGTLVKLTLGKYRGADAALRNVFVRPVALKAGPQFAFVWRYTTRDVTKNHPADEARTALAPLIGHDFLDAHLFTTAHSAQLECQPDGTGRLRVTTAVAANKPSAAPHDRPKHHLVAAEAPWLHALGVTNERGRPREGMGDKFNQIQKFAELLSHLLAEAEFPPEQAVRIVDMGSGKGYLTFALAALLGARAQVEGIEARPELVALCNRVAGEQRLDNLRFVAGQIAATAIERVDVLIALHACDTATDDALAKGIAAEAKLLVVAPCCQKELRRQLTAPPILAEALRHGIFQERQAEFVTDALRAMLLEWAGYKTKVLEFISTEHTAKNLMIAAIRVRPAGEAHAADRLRAFAAFYGIRTQRLAGLLGIDLQP